jgi:hypothetical protein
VQECYKEASDSADEHGRIPLKEGKSGERCVRGEGRGRRGEWLANDGGREVGAKSAFDAPLLTTGDLRRGMRGGGTGSGARQYPKCAGGAPAVTLNSGGRDCRPDAVCVAYAPPRIAICVGAPLAPLAGALATVPTSLLDLRTSSRQSSAPHSHLLLAFNSTSDPTSLTPPPPRAPPLTLSQLPGHCGRLVGG